LTRPVLCSVRFEQAGISVNFGQSKSVQSDGGGHAAAGGWLTRPGHWPSSPPGRALLTGGRPSTSLAGRSHQSPSRAARPQSIERGDKNQQSARRRRRGPL